MIGEALVEEGLESIGGYISFCHTSVAQYTTMSPIFDIFVAEERRAGSLETMYWWEQEGIWFSNEGIGADDLEVETE